MSGLLFLEACKKVEPAPMGRAFLVNGEMGFGGRRILDFAQEHGRLPTGYEEAVTSTTDQDLRNQDLALYYLPVSETRFVIWVNSDHGERDLRKLLGPGTTPADWNTWLDMSHSLDRSERPFTNERYSRVFVYEWERNARSLGKCLAEGEFRRKDL
jgi:hypothetical protein